ncbi:hypothetical protein GW915_12500 [bacterium]|nr:hypothetical protein [bacterium]
MKKLSLYFIPVIMLMLQACTGQLLDSFRYQQAEETFQTKTEINTKIDLLWVVDNSASMDVVQKNLREKLRGFADVYMSPNWDIQIGVITTDTFLANSAFTGYINAPISGSSGYRSLHLKNLIQDRQGRGLNAGNDSKLAALQDLGVNMSSSPGTFSSGFSYGDIVPAWARGSDYAKLIPGVRDGPISGLCFEIQATFIVGNESGSSVLGPNCGVRDSADRTGVEKCLRPDGSQKNVEECVNTTLNDTVHSGKGIIATQLPSENTDANAWREQLIDDFMVNISVGTTGSGSERGLSSVSEFLDVNETSASKFFRKDSLRGVIILADEDDQSTVIPSNPPSIYSPFSDYVCDLDALEEGNADKFANARDYLANSYKYCCSGSSCRYENLGCAEKVIDGQSFTVGICPDESKLLPVASFKNKLVDYFYELDEVVEDAENPVARTSAGANFFAISIVPKTAATVSAMRAERTISTDRLDDLQYYSGGSVVTSDRIRQVSVDYGERYIAFADEVGNGSASFDIGEPDYAVILDSIGRTLVAKKSTFQLRFAPTAKEDMIVKIIRENGDEVVVRADQYEFEGKSLTITDFNLVLSLKSTDSLSVDYQPSSLD